MFTKNERKTIQAAISIIESKAVSTDAITSASAAKSLCMLNLAHLESEVFAVVFVNSQNRLISFEKMFNGTINSCSVYPREVVKKALELNAAAVLLSHNHPSGEPIPSNADKSITKTLRDSLTLIDVRVLDHIIVGFSGTYSFAEHGLL